MESVTWPDVIRTLITAVLGAGASTLVWTISRSILAFRDNAEGREDKAIARLERFEESCRDQLECERRVSAYWYRVAGILQHALDVNGIPTPWLPPRPDEITATSTEEATK